jgi:hypothetical protein
VKRSIALFAVLALAAIGMTGCPASTQQKVAQAAQTASIVVVNFQTAEIVSYQQGIISAQDHQFIEQELGNVAVAGKALDSCIATATNTAGDLACIQTASTAINTINQQGGLGIKSATAKQEFQAAMAAFNTSLATITALLGGAK